MIRSTIWITFKTESLLNCNIGHRPRFHPNPSITLLKKNLINYITSSVKTKVFIKFYMSNSYRYNQQLLTPD